MLTKATVTAMAGPAAARVAVVAAPEIRPAETNPHQHTKYYRKALLTGPCFVSNTLGSAV